MNDLRVAVMRWGHEGFCCSQIIVLVGQTLTGRENRDLTAAANGLCRGAFSPACTCGALTGACCLLGFYAGKGTSLEEKDPRLPDMIGEFHEWFKENWGAKGKYITCGDILGDEPITDPKQYFQRCSPMILDTIEKTIEILEAHGFNVQEGRPV